ncbi:MAG: hypothetical protein JRJ77_16810, partial [Deltaproteobacteria bacterium]|nr:hypothetical protein [Deltaproteobacteria bacterium]MBW2342298.1 hypothetical protein [Deltaproteobacteria bacterium]
MKAVKSSVIFVSMVSLALFLYLPRAQAKDVVESSYHGQLGKSQALGGWGNGLGMLEKWCALPNFSFEKQGRI